MSIDIDLFTDIDYGIINFDLIEDVLNQEFQKVDVTGAGILPGIGKSYFVSNKNTESLKLDIYYTDEFIDQCVIKDNIRMASPAEILAMKIEVVQNTGRKKDFWDLHELLNKFDIYQMLNLHEKRYPYTHNKDLIIENLINFTEAEEDFNPNCLLGKYWELIKEDFIELVSTYKSK